MSLNSFGAKPLEHVAPITVQVSSWAALTEALRALDGYVFRGRPDSCLGAGVDLGA
jgi:hypothetical protein